MTGDPTEMIAAALADTKEAVDHLERALAGAARGDVEGLTLAAEAVLFACSPLVTAAELCERRILKMLAEFDMWEDPALVAYDDDD